MAGRIIHDIEGGLSPRGALHTVESPFKGAASAAHDVTGAAHDAQGFYEDVTSGDFWIRVVEVAGGFLLLTVALVSLFKGGGVQSSGKSVGSSLKAVPQVVKKASTTVSGQGGQAAVKKATSGTAKTTASQTGSAVKSNASAAGKGAKALGQKTKSDVAKKGVKKTASSVARKTATVAEDGAVLA